MQARDVVTRHDGLTFVTFGRRRDAPPNKSRPPTSLVRKNTHVLFIERHGAPATIVVVQYITNTRAVARRVVKAANYYATKHTTRVAKAEKPSRGDHDRKMT